MRPRSHGSPAARAGGPEPDRHAGIAAMPGGARVFALALGCMALAGCGNEHATFLKDLAGGATAWVSSSGDNAGMTVAGGVSFSPAGLCPTLRAEARATLNGVELPFNQRGRRYQN